MQKIGKLFFVVALGGTMLFTGCTSSKTNPQIDALQGQITQLQKENENLLKQVSDLQKQIEGLNEKEVSHETNENTSAKTTVEYPVYSSDIDTLEKEVIGTAKVDQPMSLLERLNELGKALSEVNFEGLPIVVEEIKDIKGKQIAIINLKEDASKEVGWMSTYFQGSTGGMMTATSLTETFLQKDLNSDQEWIDGIQILYEGKVTETDHMPELGKIIYR